MSLRREPCSTQRTISVSSSVCSIARRRPSPTGRPPTSRPSAQRLQRRQRWGHAETVMMRMVRSQWMTMCGSTTAHWSGGASLCSHWRPGGAAGEPQPSDYYPATIVSYKSRNHKYKFIIHFDDRFDDGSSAEAVGLLDDTVRIMTQTVSMCTCPSCDGALPQVVSCPCHGM